MINPGTCGVTVGGYIVGQVMFPLGIVTVVQPELRKTCVFYLVPPNNMQHIIRSFEPSVPDM